MRFSFDMGIGKGCLCDIDIVRVGIEHCSPHKGVVNGNRPSYSLHFVLFGQGVLVTEDGKKRILRRGQSFLLYQGERYSYYPDPSDPWSYLWVDFTGKEVETLFELCGFTKENFCKALKNFDEFIRLMQDMHSEYRAGETYKLKCEAYFLLIVGKLIDQMDQENISFKDRQSRKVVLDVISFLSNNFNMNLTNEMIAKESGVSLRTLTEFFVANINMTPMQYLTSYRVAIACERFQKTDMSVKDVATWTGYDDEKYFSRIFRKEKGISPQEYKNSKPDEDPFGWCRNLGGGFILK